MALEMFLKIDGVVGGTRNYQHKGWSDMLSWNWNLERVGDNAGGNQPCANMNQITVLKAIGKESAAILQLFAEQKKISTVEISAMPVVGKREASQKYLSIVMEDVRLCAMRTDGEADENFFRERLILEFGKIKYEIYNHTATNPGATTASGVENFTFGWNLATNVKC